MITLDFETRSKVDLKKSGAYKYSISETTQVLCLAFKIGGCEAKLWANRDMNHNNATSDSLQLLFDCIKEGALVEAHNSFFERCIWENICVPKLGWPKIRASQWRCSLSKGSALALPRDLNNLGVVLGISQQKDMEGRKIMLKMSKPRKPTKNDPSIWHEKEEDFQKLYDYCKKDTEAENQCSKIMEPLSINEMNVWQLDQKINMKGIYCDIDLVNTCLDFAKKFQKKLLERLSEMTNGKITTAFQRDRILAWCKYHGTELEGLTKAHIDAALLLDLPKKVRELLEIRKALGKSSIKKFESMIAMAAEDQRIRGTLLYHGASTGRWAGRGIQPQNFFKTSIEDVDTAIELLEMGDYELFNVVYDETLGAIASCLRGMLCAPEGKKLIAADYSAIEARVLVWLARDWEAVRRFKNNEDVYVIMAAEVYKIPIGIVDKGRRALGKVAILGLGFGMGASKFQDTCANWGIDITEKLAEKTVKIYRNQFKSVVNYWYAVEKAAVKAVKFKGTVHKVGNVAFKFEGDYLFCKLPSGRKIAYRDPTLVPGMYGDQIRFMGMDSVTKKWVRQSTYGGKLVENITQGTARDIMAEAMLRVDKAGIDIVMSVHDELVCEVNTDRTVKELETLMTIIPSWAKNCPIAAEGWEGKRFKK